MTTLKDFIREFRQQPGLESIVLDANKLQDAGIRDLADGLLERWSSFLNHLHSQGDPDSDELAMPLCHLSIRFT